MQKAANPFYVPTSFITSSGLAGGFMRWALAWLLLLLSVHTTAVAGQTADVEVYDLSANGSLSVYHHDGRMYVIGEPQHRYELRVRNRWSERILAVTSVDGVNVVTGKTAAEHQSGYVIDPWGTAVIDGWRKSLDDVATFYFTALEDSYAARTGRPRDVGVIGVALFREKSHEQVCCLHPRERLSKQEDRSAPAPMASADEAKIQGTDRAHPSEMESRRAGAPLGTGHGYREHSPAQQVEFERASTQADETIVIYYDSYRNLLSKGIVPRERHHAHERPNPFPHGFVPDP
jgi:hypothetical protein